MSDKTCPVFREPVNGGLAVSRQAMLLAVLCVGQEISEMHMLYLGAPYLFRLNSCVHLLAKVDVDMIGKDEV